MFLTGLPAAAADLGVGDAVADAQLKLLAALPSEMRERADRLREWFHHDAPSWYQDTRPAPHLRAAAEAVWRRRRVRIAYSRWEPPHEVTRTVEPYGVVLKAGQWYLVARRSGRFRTFRVSRIREIHTLDEGFERSADFDLADHWRTYLADFDDRRHGGDTAVLRLSPDGVRWLPFLLEPAVARAAQDTARPDRDGWTRVTVPVESHDWAVRELLRLGPDVEVIAPDRLRTRIAEILGATMSRYHRDR